MGSTGHLIFLRVLLICAVLGSVGVFMAIVFIKPKTFRNGMIFTHTKDCAVVGGKMMQNNGSFVDAAIAILFCEGVLNPQKVGIGGGFMAIIYRKSLKSAVTLVAQGAPPRAATEAPCPNNFCEGGLSVAIPGQVKGYYDLHRKYGRLAWAKLVEPTIELCESGSKIQNELAIALKQREREIRKVGSLRELFINTTSNKIYNQGHIIKHKTLAKTLKIIAEEGEKSIYGGKIGKLLVEDIRKFGGRLTEADFKNYSCKWDRPTEIKYLQFTIYALPYPSLGIVLQQILRGLDRQNSRRLNTTAHHPSPKLARMDENDLPELLNKIDLSRVFFEEIVNADTQNVLDVYQLRRGKPNIDVPASHVIVLSPEGDCITVTSTLHSSFGALRRSPQTGIILNDYMKALELSIDENDKNTARQITSRTGPLDLACPIIAVDPNGYPRIIASTAGNMDPTLTVAKIIVTNLHVE